MTTDLSRTLPTAAGDPPPGWVWPAVVTGLAMPALASAARRDVDLLRRLPPMPGTRFARVRSLPGIPAAIVASAAILLAVVFGFVRLGIADVYTESWLFLVLALVLGLASPAAGLLLAIAFVPLDLLAVLTRGDLDPLLPALAGRIISWWLLWLLAVVLPLVARQVPAVMLAAGRPASPGTRRIVAYTAGAATIAGLVWLWAGAVPELIRPVFTWTTGLGNPRPEVIGPVTAGRDALLLVAALVLVGATALRDLVRVVADEVAADLDSPRVTERLPALPVRLRPVRWIAVTGVGLLLLGAMVSAPIDIVLLGGALLASRPGVRRLVRRFPMALLLLCQLPWLLRFGIGCGLAWLTSTLLTFLLAGPAFGSDRFPIVVATSVAILVIALLLEVDAATDDLFRERDERAAARTVAAAMDSPAHPAHPAEPVLPAEPASSRRAVAAGVGLAASALLIPALALAQGGVPCAVGATCLPPAAMSAAAATGAAAMLALTMGAGGRFVSMRRDSAIRRPMNVASAAGGVRGLAGRARAAILAAWRAG